MITNVLFFGFSVTEEKGYIQALKELYADSDIAIDHMAIGGVNISCLPYIEPELNYSTYDFVFFEVTTCMRYSQDNLQAYSEPLTLAIQQARAQDCEPAFIHLYREGVDYEHDTLLETAFAVCDANQVSAVNLVPEIIKFRERGDLALYLRDGTHTTPKGASFYANGIKSFVDEIVGTTPDRSGVDSEVPIKASLLKVDEIVADREILYFERGNIKIPYLEIQAEEKVRFELPAGMSLYGVLYIRGPRAGIFEAGLTGLGSFKILAFDQFSYYRRYSVWMAPKPGATDFTLSQLTLEPDVALAKGERYTGDKVGEVCGFLVRSE